MAVLNTQQKRRTGFLTDGLHPAILPSSSKLHRAQWTNITSQPGNLWSLISVSRDKDCSTWGNYFSCCRINIANQLSCRKLNQLTAMFYHTVILCVAQLVPLPFFFISCLIKKTFLVAYRSGTGKIQLLGDGYVFALFFTGGI